MKNVISWKPMSRSVGKGLDLINVLWKPVKVLTLQQYLLTRIFKTGLEFVQRITQQAKTANQRSLRNSS